MLLSKCDFALYIRKKTRLMYAVCQSVWDYHQIAWKSLLSRSTGCMPPNMEKIYPEMKRILKIRLIQATVKYFRMTLKFWNFLLHCLLRLMYTLLPCCEVHYIHDPLVWRGQHRRPVPWQSKYHCTVVRWQYKCHYTVTIQMSLYGDKRNVTVRWQARY